jgi:enoyl-CoA hydratase
MSFSTLQYEIESDGTAVIMIDREDRLNALNSDVINDLDECFRQARVDDNVKGIILTGKGEKAFVAGADIRQFTDLDPLAAQRFAVRGQAVFNRIEEMPVPVIAAVNGFALGGGCELALACHIRVASDNARFGQPEVSLGIIPGYGGTQRLPRLVGKGIATELILAGEMIDAERAFAIGLVNRVVSRDQLLDSAREMIRSISSKAPVAVAFALEALRASDLPLRQGLRHEAALFGQACATEDFKEGVSAFLEKRKASFKGK